ncbi:MAG: transporter substrate-binding domain-containing protein, partial [Deltaproteobacteria bacterium]|nr:transporter substrate-binding domain-containing protein [Deltaproteobacteria bacterium]
MRMIRASICKTLLLAGLCGLMSPVYADTAGVQSADETIIVGGDHAFPPYEFLDNKGRPAGYNVDLIRAVAEVMDLKIKIRLGPWSEMRDALENRQIDALMGMFYSE